MRKLVNVLIPMAGAGSRFHQAGYSVPKPLIKVFEKTMIRTSIDTLKLKGIDCNYIFVARRYKEQEHNDALKKELLSIDPEANIVYVNELTEGSACTCLYAKYVMNKDLPLFIFNCDQVFNFSQRTVDTIYNVVNSNLNGAVITWKDTNPKNSFCEVSENCLCYNFTEKQPVSDNALIGFHYWRKTSDFISSAEKMIEQKLKFNNEYYIAPTYNFLDKIVNIPITKDECYLIGTPADLDYYLEKPKITTVLFDLDGVIADTEELHTRAFKQAVGEFGYCEEFVDYVPLNLTTEEKILALANKFNKSKCILDLKKEIVERKRAIYEELLHRNTFTTEEELSKVFSYLEQQKINYYVVTNSSRFSSYKLLRKLGFYSLLKHQIICADDCKMHKPNAEPYVRAILKFGLDINTTIAIEDSDEGYKSATSAGLSCIKIKDAKQCTLNFIKDTIANGRFMSNC
jgi:HAD superfamily hydrolase (TIGR01509 family)